MAVDKSYGSGKSRSAANSRARRRAAAGQMTKGPKTITRALKKIASENPMTGFIGGGILPAKLLKAASSLRAAGQVGKAAAVESRVLAKQLGSARSSNLSIRSGKTPVSNLSPRLLDSAQRVRNQSESVFPRRSGAQSGEFLGMNSREITANLARKTGRASGLGIEDIGAFSKATAQSTTKFTNFSKNLKKRGGR